MAATKPLLAGTGILALLALSACGSDNEATPTQTETVTVTTEAPSSPKASSSASTEASSEASSEASESASASASSSSSSAAASGAYTNDDVASAIDAALAEYSAGTVVALDTADNGQSFDLDVVDGETVHEVRVDRDGKVTTEESETERNSDEVTEAGEAQVSAKEALEKATENHADAVVDGIELERENGTLSWQVELDDAQGRDAATVWVNAADGSVTER